jgi:hypothetical protein
MELFIVCSGFFDTAFPVLRFCLSVLSRHWFPFAPEQTLPSPTFRGSLLPPQETAFAFSPMHCNWPRKASVIFTLASLPKVDDLAGSFYLMSMKTIGLG